MPRRATPTPDGRLALARAKPTAAGGRRGIDSTAAALGITVVVGVLALAGEHKFGLGGLALPLGLALLVIVMRRPLAMFYVTIGLTLLCEGSTVRLPAMKELYSNLYGGIEPITLLVVLTFLSVVFERLRTGRALRLSAISGFAVLLILFAGIDGVAVARGVGVSPKTGALATLPLVELILMILAVYNMDLTNAQIVTLLKWGLAAAAFKAVMGLGIMSLGLSAEATGGTSLTYYEPTANWLGLMAILGLLAAGLGDDAATRARLAAVRSRLRVRSSRAGGYDQPLISTRATWRQQRRWKPERPVVTLADSPATRARSQTGALVTRLRSRWGLIVFVLATACLLLSYRRSFWIGAVVALLILIPLASTPRKRLMIIPTALCLAGAIWAIQAVHFQAVTPIVKRASSLNPNAVSVNAEDRYRLDERVNVVAEIKRNPLAGIGVDVPWVTTVRSLGIEHPGGRLYVDFGLLSWWLKMGVLGAAAYVAFLVTMATLAVQTWRRHAVKELRAFGLASLTAAFALVAIETTASFTGVDARFSALIGAQFGLLALLADRRSETPEVAEPQAPGMTEPVAEYGRRVPA